MKQQRKRQRASEPAKANSADLRLAEFLPYRLNVAAYRMTHALSLIYRREFDLGVPEWRVVFVLGELSKISTREICAITHMHKARVSRIVDRLTLRKILVKQTNGDDHRLVEVTLSRKGKALYRDITALALDWETRVFGSATGRGKRSIIAALCDLERALDRSSKTV